jgi:hypothetical protein
MKPNLKFFFSRLRQIRAAPPTPDCKALKWKDGGEGVFAEGGKTRFLVCAIYVFGAIACMCVGSCNRDKEPFTAEQRFFVDSVSGIRIRETQKEIDSLCKIKETTEVPRLADSLYRIRRAQMEQKLKEFKSGN